MGEDVGTHTTVRHGGRGRGRMHRAHKRERSFRHLAPHPGSDWMTGGQRRHVGRRSCGRVLHRFGRRAVACWITGPQTSALRAFAQTARPSEGAPAHTHRRTRDGGKWICLLNGMLRQSWRCEWSILCSAHDRAVSRRSAFLTVIVDLLRNDEERRHADRTAQGFRPLLGADLAALTCRSGSLNVLIGSTGPAGANLLEVCSATTAPRQQGSRIRLRPFPAASVNGYEGHTSALTRQPSRQHKELGPRMFTRSPSVSMAGGWNDESIGRHVSHSPRCGGCAVLLPLQSRQPRAPRPYIDSAPRSARRALHLAQRGPHPLQHRQRSRD